MYLDFYGLSELPFELTPNPKYLYMTPSHREALSNLQYGLATAKAVTVVTGEAGTGKTTLIRAAVDSEWCRHVRCVHLNNPTLTRNEFIETLARRFELSSDAAQSKATFLGELEAVLLERRASGVTTALVVDEAHTLSAELLEEIRLLANIETHEEKLLPLVLVGQPELGARLDEPGLRQLKQRVALRCELPRFQLPHTAAYIATRIRVAGGQASRLFTREAVMAIHDHSHGIARTISVICDNALVSGLALGRRPVDNAVVLEVCRDFVLDGGVTPASMMSAARDMGGEANSQDAPPPGDEDERRAPRSLADTVRDAVRPNLFQSFRSRR